MATDGPRNFLEMQDQVTNDVTNAVRDTLGDNNYSPQKVPDWVDRITTRVIEALTQRSETLKYIVSVIILEKKNGGFHLFSTCFWDQEEDGTITVRWDNKTMHCVVSVFGISLP